jgi:hypothetical protein
MFRFNGVATKYLDSYLRWFRWVETHGMLPESRVFLRDAATGTVIYRSKMHAGLKRNFHVMPGAAWLELLCKHIPDRYEHLVHYVG